MCDGERMFDAVRQTRGGGTRLRRQTVRTIGRTRSGESAGIDPGPTQGWRILSWRPPIPGNGWSTCGRAMCGLGFLRMTRPGGRLTRWQRSYRPAILSTAAATATTRIPCAGPRRLPGMASGVSAPASPGGIRGLENGHARRVGSETGAATATVRFRTLLAPAPQSGGWHCGPSGAGHFVKMVRNGSARCARDSADMLWARTPNDARARPRRVAAKPPSAERALPQHRFSDPDSGFG